MVKDRHTDLKYLKEASANNIEFIAEMIQIFLKQTPDFLTDLKLYSESKNWEESRKIMHKMKPTLIMMGIKSIDQDLQKVTINVKEQVNLESVPPFLETLTEVCTASFKELKEELKTLKKMKPD